MQIIATGFVDNYITKLKNIINVYRAEMIGGDLKVLSNELGLKKIMSGADFLALTDVIERMNDNDSDTDKCGNIYLEDLHDAICNKWILPNKWWKKLCGNIVMSKSDGKVCVVCGINSFDCLVLHQLNTTSLSFTGLGLCGYEDFDFEKSQYLRKKSQVNTYQRIISEYSSEIADYESKKGDLYVARK